MAKTTETPGVYIQELNAFPNSVVGVPTAVPVFVGYTLGNTFEGQLYQNKPVQINSLSDYVAFFCNGQQPAMCQTQFAIAPAAANASYDISLNGVNYNVTPQANTFFYLYNSIQLFYQNGGGTCYVLSVGTYDKEGANGPSITNFLHDTVNVFDILKTQTDITLVLIPDALLFTKADYYTLMNACLNHCNDTQSRMALIDAYGGNTISNADTFIALSKQQDAAGNTLDPIGQLRGNLTSDFLNYGAAYFPFLNTGIVSNNQLNFTNIIGGFTTTYVEPNAINAVTDILKQIPTEASLDPKLTAAEKAAIIAAAQTTAHIALLKASANYAQLINVMLAKVNCLPATPAVAGCMSTIDNTRGVWTAPAGVGTPLANVYAPVMPINDTLQSGMNVDAITGKSVNAIRTFTGYGNVIWGARTLDGNSQDWRYINVRRTVIMIEQSILLALRAYVFQPNDANTWVAVNSMITNFLTGLWKQGALSGAKPGDAFSVSVGLSTTMTAQDILDGYMNVSVLVAVTHPAEFIELTFRQQMQTS